MSFFALVRVKTYHAAIIFILDAVISKTFFVTIFSLECNIKRENIYKIFHIIYRSFMAKFWNSFCIEYNCFNDFLRSIKVFDYMNSSILQIWVRYLYKLIIDITFFEYHLKVWANMLWYSRQGFEKIICNRETRKYYEYLLRKHHLALLCKFYGNGQTL